MSKDVILLGTGGHSKVIADLVLQSGDRVLGFLDDGDPGPRSFCGFPVLGPAAAWKNYPDAWFLIAIGSAAVRKRLAEAMTGARFYTAMHPSAVISPMDTAIGEGTVVMAGAVVNPCARIGRHCILNTASVVEHDNRIGDYAHISVGAKLAGTVTIGESTWVGIGAVVSNNLSLCPDCKIGAGAVVVKNIEEPGTYVGVPARKVQ